MKKLLCILVLFVGLFTYSQKKSKSPCATDDILKRELKENPLLKEQMDLMNAQIQQTKSTGKEFSLPPQGSIQIPVVVYVIHNGENIGDGANISDDQVNAQIDALNNKFFDTGIKFCLATRAGSGNIVPKKNDIDVENTPGIIHINNPLLTNHVSSTEGQQALLNTIHSSVTADNYLRIWIVSSINGDPPGILGYATFPFGYTAFDGIVIRNDVFGNESSSNLIKNYKEGETLVHEVGHYLGLYHTFEGGCETINQDCLLDGDCVCDTPKVAAANFYCVEGTNSCLEIPEEFDLIHNYMDYGTNVCTDSFTTGQKERMISVLTLYRSNLITNDNILYTGSCDFNNLISATISPDKYTTCSNVPIVFSALEATSYSWDFGDGSISNIQNPIHNFTSSTNSPYTVTLTVTNSTTGQSAMSSIKIFVSDCMPIQNNNASWYMGWANLMNFQTGIPVLDPTFPIANYARGTTSIQSDSGGNLLFYSNGCKIWNNQHSQINSTTTHIGYNGGNLIVPNPGNVNQYYVFNVTGAIGTFPGGPIYIDNALRYSLVNVTGTTATMLLEDEPVTPSLTYGISANNSFMTSSSDGAIANLTPNPSILAIKKCDGYWIITTLNKDAISGPGNIVVFSLTSGGLIYHSDIQLPSFSSYMGQLKASPNGNKIFLNSIFTNRILYDFDKAKGLINSPKIINFPNLSDPNYYKALGICFSPDSKKLYISEAYPGIFQYNIDSANINDSRFKIGSVTGKLGGDLEPGPDDKIYASISFSNELAVIHNPNNLSNVANNNACNFSQHGPKNNYSPPGYNYFMGLPNIIVAKEETVFPTLASEKISVYITGCNTYKFFPNVCGNLFKWVFENVTTGTIETVIDTDPVYTFTTSGNYKISLRDSNDNFITYTSLSITSPSSPVILGSNSACLFTNSITNNSVHLSPGETANWSIPGAEGIITGNINNSPSVNVSWTSLPGNLSLTVTNTQGCSVTVNKTIYEDCCECLNSVTINPMILDPIYSGGPVATKLNLSTICQSGNLSFTWYYSNLPHETTFRPTSNYHYGDPVGVKMNLSDANGNITCDKMLYGTQTNRMVNPKSNNENNSLYIEPSITPNPSKGMFTMSISQFKGNLNYKITDISGKMIFESNNEYFESEKIFDLSNFQSGIYILKIEGDNINYTTKLIKN